MALQRSLFLAITVFCLAARPGYAFVVSTPKRSARTTTWVPHTCHNMPVTRRVSLSATALTGVPVVAGNIQFQGHSTYSEIYNAAGNSDNNNNKNCHVILIHGFGCSTVYWRETIRTLLQRGYTVHALDLLGQGKSAKPGRADGIEYSINLWAQQVEEYARAKIPATTTSRIVLMGNSLGSVVALTAATGDYLTNNNNEQCFVRQYCQGIGMYNCGVGMNSRNVLLEFSGIQKVVFTAVFDLLDALLFGNIPLLTYVLDKVVTKELLRNALMNLYQYASDPAARVDDALVDSFYEPAKDPGSPETLSQIYTNDPGSTPMEMVQRHEEFLQTQVPIHLVWGQQDGITPVTGSVGQFFQRLANEDGSNVSINLITGGHIPFDEVPECNDLMVQWLDNLDKTSSVQTTQQFTNTLFGAKAFKLPFFS